MASMFGGIVSAVNKLVFGDGDAADAAHDADHSPARSDIENDVWSSNSSSALKSPAHRHHSSSASHPPGTCGESNCRSRRRLSLGGKRKRQALTDGLHSEFGCPLCFELLVTPFDGFECGHMLCGQCLLEMVEHEDAARVRVDDFDFFDSEEQLLRHLHMPSCPSCRKRLTSLPKPAIPIIRNAIDLVAKNSLSGEEKDQYETRVAEEPESHFRTRFSELLQSKLDFLGEYRRKKEQYVALQSRSRRMEQQARERRRRAPPAAAARPVLPPPQGDDGIDQGRQGQQRVVGNQDRRVVQQNNIIPRHVDQHVHHQVPRVLQRPPEPAEVAAERRREWRPQPHSPPERNQPMFQRHVVQEVHQHAHVPPHRAHRDQALEGGAERRRYAAAPPPLDHPGARDQALDRRVAQVIEELEDLPRRVSLALEHGGDNGNDRARAPDVEQDLLNAFDPEDFDAQIGRIIDADYDREVERVLNDEPEREFPSQADVARARANNERIVDQRFRQDNAQQHANGVLRRSFEELDARNPTWEYDRSGRAKCRLCDGKIDRSTLRVKLMRPQHYWHAQCAFREHSHYFGVRAQQMPGHGDLSAVELAYLAVRGL